MAEANTSSSSVFAHSVGALFVVIIKEAFSWRVLIRLKKPAASSFFTRACYLSPYETLPEPTDTAGEYTASFSGPGVLAFLLTGSPLFSGYATTGSAALAGDCVFTVHVSDGKISDYSYSFTLDVTDGDDVFSAQIVISSEVI